MPYYRMPHSTFEVSDSARTNRRQEDEYVLSPVGFLKHSPRPESR